MHVISYAALLLMSEGSQSASEKVFGSCVLLEGVVDCFRGWSCRSKAFVRDAS